jgi:hypothetical protein
MWRRLGRHTPTFASEAGGPCDHELYLPGHAPAAPGLPFELSDAGKSDKLQSHLSRPLKARRWFAYAERPIVRLIGESEQNTDK